MDVPLPSYDDQIFACLLRQFIDALFGLTSILNSYALSQLRCA